MVIQLTKYLNIQFLHLVRNFNLIMILKTNLIYFTYLWINNYFNNVYLMKIIKSSYDLINCDFKIRKILNFLHYFQTILNHSYNQIFINIIISINIVECYLIKIILLIIINNYYNTYYC